MDDSMAARVGRPTSFSGVWRIWYEHFGGVDAIASALQVHRKNVQAWALSHRKPNIGTLRWIDVVAKRHKLPNPFEDEMLALAEDPPATKGRHV